MLVWLRVSLLCIVASAAQQEQMHKQEQMYKRTRSSNAHDRVVAPAATCTLPARGQCCQSTRWSTFKWRAKSSDNMPFSLAGAAHDSRTPAAAQDSATDVLTVCLASKNLGGCTNATAANAWSSWRAFTAECSRALCGVYPNINDPSRSLIISAEVHGVLPGNMSTITVEIQPGGARSHEPNYQLNATVTPMRQMEDAGTHFAPAVRILEPNFYLVLFAENHTAQLPVITGRANNRKYYKAMPSPVATPRRIRILQEYDARDDDVGAHRDAADALVRQLGASALRVAGNSAAAQQIAEASGALYASGRLVTPCNHTRCKTDHSFPATTEQEVDTLLNSWATAWVNMMKGTGVNMSRLTQMEMYDEIGCVP